MKVIFKDISNFKIKMFKKGFNPSTLSLAIDRSRQYMFHSLERGTIGAKAATDICSVLNEEYNELFKIEK